jgi:hypothetical protein
MSSTEQKFDAPTTVFRSIVAAFIGGILLTGTLCQAIAEEVGQSAPAVGISETADSSAGVSPGTPATAAPAVDPNTPCLPPCRSGYLCHKGQCISLCNPPCPPGTICTGNGECISEGQTRSAPAHRAEPEEVAVTEIDRRYKGFFMEIRPLGLGTVRSQLYYGGSSSWPLRTGTFSTLGMAVGAAPVENLTLYGCFDFEFPISGSSQIVMELPPNTIVDSMFMIHGLFGIGARYYFPMQFFASLEAGLKLGPQIDNDYDDEVASHDWYAIDTTIDGAAVMPYLIRLSAGKEWWMGQKWTIGVVSSIAWGQSTMGGEIYYRSQASGSYVTVQPYMKHFMTSIGLRLAKH